MSTTTTPTPGQTVGPFFGFALEHAGGPHLVPANDPGAVRLHGRVLDGAGEPVPDALLELWQADASGRVPQRPGSLRRDGATSAGWGSAGGEFTGWGRTGTDADGRYAFTTVRPGPTADGAAPFFALTVFARGLLHRLFTRAYLPGDDAGLAADRLLASVGPDRRRTLVAREDEDGLAFDIRLQGDDETVFLTFPRERG